MNRLYSYQPDGYCGDEDNGQTSAWYVFSALGFYPVTPASTQYVVGAPLFRKAEIHFENGNSLEIEASNNSDKNRYVNSARFRGDRLKVNYLDHFDVLKGGNLKFKMDDKPNKERNTEASAQPFSMSTTP